MSFIGRIYRRLCLSFRKREEDYPGWCEEEERIWNESNLGKPVKVQEWLDLQERISNEVSDN